jgi:hypothetical protein
MIDVGDHSGVAYKIDCLDSDQTYVGETSKKLSTRVGQHQASYKNRKSPGSKTALINHSLDTNHKFNFPDATVLDSERHVKKRRLLEGGHIIVHSPRAVNIKSDSSNIGSQYYEIIERYSIGTSPRIPLVHGTSTATLSNVPSLNLLPNR